MLAMTLSRRQHSGMMDAQSSVAPILYGCCLAALSLSLPVAERFAMYIKAACKQHAWPSHVYIPEKACGHMLLHYRTAPQVHNQRGLVGAAVVASFRINVVYGNTARFQGKLTLSGHRVCNGIGVSENQWPSQRPQAVGLR